MGLLLAAVDVDGPLRWRWLLSEEKSDLPLADHQVDLSAEPAEVARFADLYRYARSYAAPDRVVSDGARFVAESGAWAGREVLGPSIGSAIVAAVEAEPLTVRVQVPAALDRILLWPLELAQVDGRPLAARGDVTLVYDIATTSPAGKRRSPMTATAGTFCTCPGTGRVECSPGVPGWFALLGLIEQAEALEAESADGGSSAEVRDLARVLKRELGCAMVGMRYPVADETRWRRRARPWPLAAARRRCCCTAWPARGRPPARSTAMPASRGRS